MFYRWFDSGWFLPTVFLMYSLAIELGYRLSLIRPREQAAGTRPMAGAIVLLLALMLSFTIREQSQSYRKTLAFQGDEVDAVSDAWRLMELLSPPERTRLMEALKLYLKVHTSSVAPDPETISKLQNGIWAEVRSAREILGDKATAPLVSCLNKVIQTHYQVTTNSRQRLPVSIGNMDLTGILLVSFLVGYASGSRGGRAWTVYAIFLGMVMLSLFSMQTLARLRKGVGSENSKRLEAVYRAMEEHT
jgi:hypothetical protein